MSCDAGIVRPVLSFSEIEPIILSRRIMIMWMNMCGSDIDRAAGFIPPALVTPDQIEEKCVAVRIEVDLTRAIPVFP